MAHTEQELANLSLQLSGLLAKTMGKALISVGVGDQEGYPEFILYVRKGRSLGFVMDDYMGIPVRVIRVSSVTY